MTPARLWGRCCCTTPKRNIRTTYVELSSKLARSAYGVDHVGRNWKIANKNLFPLHWLHMPSGYSPCSHEYSMICYANFLFSLIRRSEWWLSYDEKFGVNCGLSYISRQSYIVKCLVSQGMLRLKWVQVFLKVCSFFNSEIFEARPTSVLWSKLRKMNWKHILEANYDNIYETFIKLTRGLLDASFIYN